eukprot:g29710.t1
MGRAFAAVHLASRPKASEIWTWDAACRMPHRCPKLSYGTAFLTLPAKKVPQRGFAFLDAAAEVPAESDPIPKQEADRHFVACKKPLPLGEPRACEMEGYEACEEWPLSGVR